MGESYEKICEVDNVDSAGGQEMPVYMTRVLCEQVRQEREDEGRDTCDPYEHQQLWMPLRSCSQWPELYLYSL